MRPLVKGDTEALYELGGILLSMTSVPLTDDVYERTATVRASTGLKPPDAIHVVT